MSIATSNSVIPGNIKRIISEKGLKRSYVATRIGVSPTTFSSMLNGRRLILISDTINIASALGVPPADLFATEEAHE